MKLRQWCLMDEGRQFHGGSGWFLWKKDRKKVMLENMPQKEMQRSKSNQEEHGHSK